MFVWFAPLLSLVLLDLQITQSFHGSSNNKGAQLSDNASCSIGYGTKKKKQLRKIENRGQTRREGPKRKLSTDQGIEERTLSGRLVLAAASLLSLCFRKGCLHFRSKVILPGGIQSDV